MPALWPLEIANVMLGAQRRGRIDKAGVEKYLATLQTLAIEIDDDTSALAWNKILALGERFGLTAHDAAYLELALRKGLPLASLDQRLREACVNAGGRVLLCAHPRDPPRRCARGDAHFLLARPRAPLTLSAKPMLSGILLALAASLVYGFLGVAFEAAAKRNYPAWPFIFWKQLYGTGLIFAVLLIMRKPLYHPQVLGLAAIGALSYVLTCACYLTASRERDIAANWTIVNLSVLVPLGASILWFGDKFTGLKAAGALLTLVAIVLVGGKATLGSVVRGDSRWKTFIFGAFLLNGVLSTLFRWVPAEDSFLFVGYFYAVSFVMALPFMLTSTRAPARPAANAPLPTSRLSRGMLGWSLVGAASHCTGMLLTMAALAAVAKVSQEPGVVVYPITNGFVIPLGVVLGAIILRQVIDRRRWLGVAIGMAGLVLLSLP